MSQLQKLRNARGNRCEYCFEPLAYRRVRIEKDKVHYRPNLEFAHVAPTHLVGKKRRTAGHKAVLRDIRKNADCFALLCFRCHFRLDNHYEHPNPPSFPISYTAVSSCEHSAKSGLPCFYCYEQCRETCRGTLFRSDLEKREVKDDSH